VDPCHYHPRVAGWRACPGCAVPLCVLCLAREPGRGLACRRCGYLLIPEGPSVADRPTIPLVGPSRTTCGWPTDPPCTRATRVYVEIPPGSDRFVGVCRKHQRRWERRYAAEIAAHYPPKEATDA
jgi:hypothetical protein